MIVGVPRETRPSERRVALVPDAAAALAKKKIDVVVESGAGLSAGFPDAAYVAKGARIVPRAEVFQTANIITQIHAAQLDAAEGLHSGQTVIGMLDPWSNAEKLQAFAALGLNAFSLELIPRITRAQSMDVLSSMATIAGYKAVLLAAESCVKMFPMMMTAAGTLAPAKVFVLGVGVAGLQAIATARRLGAVVEAYDVRPAVKEQVVSVGGKFIELPLETANAQDSGGYAKSQDETFLQRQRELMIKVVSSTDVVITTAAVPGKPAPKLVTKEMVEAMPQGAVIVDLAAERGGNCELSKPGEVAVHNGVFILAPLNLPATVPYHASQMFSRNVATFIQHRVKDDLVQTGSTDEIITATLLTSGGAVVKQLG